MSVDLDDDGTIVVVLSGSEARIIANDIDKMGKTYAIYAETRTLGQKLGGVLS